MINRQKTGVLVNQRKRRAGDVLRHAKAGTDALNAGGFAGAEIAAKTYHRSRSQFLCECRAEFFRLGRTVDNFIKDDLHAAISVPM